MTDTSSSVTRVAASAALLASSSARTENSSNSWVRSQRRTRDPWLGTVSMSPSESRRRNASRTGVRLTSSDLANSTSPRRAPSSYVPSRMPRRMTV